MSAQSVSVPIRITFEFTGLRGFLRRSGGMMGWGTAAHVRRRCPSRGKPTVDGGTHRRKTCNETTTWQRTTLGMRTAGQRINIETDILARLIISRLDALVRGGGGASEQSANSVSVSSSEMPGASLGGGVSWEKLREAGFVV